MTFSSATYSADTIDGGGGNDTIDGAKRGAITSFSVNILFGEEGNDSILGGDGFDYIDGGSFDDVLQGFGGNDGLVDVFGNNRLYGGDGNDNLVTDSGNDVLSGGSGDDYLTGDDGDDYLNGYGYTVGVDNLNGGGGNDIFVLGDDSASRGVYYLGSGHAIIREFSYSDSDGGGEDLIQLRGNKTYDLVRESLNGIGSSKEDTQIYHVEQVTGVRDLIGIVQDVYLSSLSGNVDYVYPD